jgi:ferritin
MLIGKRLNDAINKQIGSEFYASIQYVGVAAYFDDEALPVLAAFFYRQAEEERGHAMKFVKYVVETGGELKIPAIDEPVSGFQSAEEVVALALKQEGKVTEEINNLMNIAREENDHLAVQFLQWFVDEQLEEMSTMDGLLKTVKRAGEGGLLQVETYLERLGDPHAGEDGHGH